MAFVHPLNLEAKRGGEVFFVAKHHVNKRSKRTIYFLRFRFSSDRVPERTAVVQVIGDDGACSLCSLHRLSRHLRSCLRKRAKNAAGVKPSRALFDKDLLPIDVTRLELRNGGMSPVRTPQRSTRAKSALGEIQAVSNGAAHAVVIDPTDMTLIDAALEH